MIFSKFVRKFRCDQSGTYGLKTCANDVESQGLSNAEGYLVVRLMVWETSYGTKKKMLKIYGYS